MGGKHATHVANAYECDVYVKCDADRSYVEAAKYSSSTEVGVKGASVGVSQSGTVELDWHKVEADFSHIPSGKWLKFDVDVVAGKDVVYISVFAKDGKLIANGLQRYSDYSIIITKKGGYKGYEIWKSLDRHKRNRSYAIKITGTLFPIWNRNVREL